jgi:hypothetical protein
MTNSNDALREVWQAEQQMTAALRDSLNQQRNSGSANYHEPQNTGVDFSEYQQAAYSEAAKDQAIRQWCRANGKDADNSQDYAEAMNALGYFY